jgi:hypothetical protein
MGKSRMTLPQAGHRAFFPTESAGALSFFPQEQRTVNIPSVGMTHPP